MLAHVAPAQRQRFAGAKTSVGQQPPEDHVAQLWQVGADELSLGRSQRLGALGADRKAAQADDRVGGEQPLAHGRSERRGQDAARLVGLDRRAAVRERLVAPAPHAGVPQVA